MPIVTFYPSKKTVEVEANTSLYRAAELAGLPIASSCNGNFVCGKCNVQIVEGRENLSPQTQPEQVLLERESHPSADRISCRTHVIRDCVITTRYW